MKYKQAVKKCKTILSQPYFFNLLALVATRPSPSLTVPLRKIL